MIYTCIVTHTVYIHVYVICRVCCILQCMCTCTCITPVCVQILKHHAIYMYMYMYTPLSIHSKGVHVTHSFCSCIYINYSPIHDIVHVYNSSKVYMDVLCACTPLDCIECECICMICKHVYMYSYIYSAHTCTCIRNMQGMLHFAVLVHVLPRYVYTYSNTMPSTCTRIHSQSKVVHVYYTYYTVQKCTCT